MVAQKSGELGDRMLYKTRWLIRRFPTHEHFLRNDPQPVPDLGGPVGSFLPAESIVEGNVLLNEGITALWNIITGAAANTKWDNGNAKIGVGDNGDAAANNQTGLLAPTNKAWQGMNANYPQVSSQTATWQSIFDANTANFGWKEFTIVNANNDTGQNLNRVSNNQGTKTVGQTWTISVQITLA